MSKLRLAVIYGGASPEHEVSIITAVQVMRAAKNHYEVIPLYATKLGTILTGNHLNNLSSYQDLPLLTKMSQVISLPTQFSDTPQLSSQPLGLLRKTTHRPFDLLLPCFHGGVGEGGWIQGIAEYYQIPLVGTGLTGAALGMDKVAMKHVFASAGINQANYLWYYRSYWQNNQKFVLKEIESTLKYPLFVKPSRGGSSIGTTCANTKAELIRALDLATTLDSRIVVEEGIINAHEINISLMGNAGSELSYSACEEVFHSDKSFLDFESKYLSSGKSEGMASTNRIIPADLSPKVLKTIQDYSTTVFNTLDLSGLVRIDYLVKNHQVYCVEVNTIPGSLSFYLWEKSGYPFPKLIDNLVELALAKHTESKTIQKDFGSSILKSIGSLGSKLSNKLGN